MTALTLGQAQAYADELSARWRSGPPIRVVASPAEFPVPARAHACGLIHGGIAYLAANNHACRLDVARTLVHEAVGHFGLWRILGTDGRRRLERELQAALEAGDEALLKIRSRVRRRYVDAQGRYTLTSGQECDEIAAFAAQDAIDPESGQFRPGFGMFKSVYARLAQWLRRDMGIRIPFTLSELQGALVNAMRGLQAGRRLDGLPAQGQAAEQAREVAFSFAGEGARTADPAALQSARERLSTGQDGQGIWQATGWGKAADGQWRFEISDDQARLLSPKQSREAAAQRVARDVLVIAQRQRIEEQISQLDSQADQAVRQAYGRSRRGEICEEERERVLDQAQSRYTADLQALRGRLGALPEPSIPSDSDAQGSIRLDDYLHHPTLFDAYPRLGAIRVSPSSNPDIEGAYTLGLGQKAGAIEIKAALPQAQELTVLLHEIQHAIQFIEGFATGGKVLTANVYLPQDTVQEIARLNASADEVGLLARYDEARALRNQASQVRVKAGFERYWRLAGEVEARNTEARQAMTPAQRRSSWPESTADVKGADAIVHHEVMPTAALSFAGPLALTAQPEQLERARRFLAGGQDPEAVRQATGWHQGVDAKWRYEIDDSRAFLKGGGTFGEIVMRRYKALNKQGSPIVLGDILFHTALFSAYPALAQAPIEFVPKGVNAKGQLGSDGTLRLQRHLPYEQALSVLLHELQHAIQHVEGFALGGCPLGIRQLLQQIADERRGYADFARRTLDAAADLERAASYLEVIGQLQRNPASITKTLLWYRHKPFAVPKAPKARARAVRDVAEKAVQALRSEIQCSHAADFMQGEGYAAEPSKLRGLACQILRDLPQGNKDDLAMVQKLESMLDQHADFSLYRRLAGEIEARNTQARQGLTPAQRLATPPEATADTKADQSIVTFVLHAAPEAASEPAALRAVATDRRSPITGQPLFEILNAAGAVLERVHRAASCEEALQIVTLRAARARQAPAPAALPCEPAVMPKACAPSSGWKIYRGPTDSLAEPDEYLYHITTHAAARRIIREGLVPGAGKMFGQAYSAYSTGKAFLTDSTGVNYWRHSIEQQLHAAHDNPPAVAVVRIAKADVAGMRLLPDLVGSTDARAKAYFATEKVTNHGKDCQAAVNIQAQDMEEQPSPMVPRG